VRRISSNESVLSELESEDNSLLNKMPNLELKSRSQKTARNRRVAHAPQKSKKELYRDAVKKDDRSEMTELACKWYKSKKGKNPSSFMKLTMFCRENGVPSPDKGECDKYLETLQ